MFSKLKYDDKTNRTSFEISEVDISIVNGVRRIILTNIPILGFRASEVNIIKNTGPLHNEFMSHRISLLPIHYSSDELDNFIPETADEYELNVSNTNSADVLDITTHDFKTKDGSSSVSKNKNHKELFPVHPISKMPILITRLRPNEELHLIAKPVKSTAVESSSFAPVSLCTIQFIQDPNKTKHLTEILDKERAYCTNEYGDPNNILFELEPETGLSPKYIVDKAFQILIDKVNGVIDKLSSDDHPDVKIKDIETESGNGVEIVFNNEDDTLGNLLQSMLHNHFVRSEEKSKTIKYVGYVCPHPLETTMILNVRGPSSDTNYIEEVVRCCREEILPKLTNIRALWNQFAK